MGLLIGGICLILMNTPWIYGQGLIFDTRSILLSISGLFFGTIPTAIAMVIASIYRFSQGGAYLTGISVILATGLLGIGFRYLKRNKPINFTWWQLYLFGVVAHVVMLLLMFTQSLEVALPLLSKISLPVMLIYPIGTMLLGMLILNRLRAEKESEENQKNQRRLRSMVDLLQFTSEETRSYVDFAMEEAVKLTESQMGFLFFYSEETNQFTLSSWSTEAINVCTIPNPQMIYDLDETGFWGEPVRQRKAIIANNFEAPNRFKKGFPDGHPGIVRLLEIPVFIENKIVAVAGVANKLTDYSEADSTQLSLLMETVLKSSERRKALDALRVSEENYRLLFDQATDGIFIFSPEKDLLEVNEYAANILGYSRDEIQKKYKEILQDDPGRTDIDNFSRDLRAGKQIATEQKLTTKKGDLIDVEIVTQVLPDGRIQKVFRNITDRKRAAEKDIQTQKELRDLLEISDESRRALLSVIEDQKIIEEALRNSEKSYRNLFENITQGFALHRVILDEDGKPIDYEFLAANPAYEKLTGLIANEIIGKLVTEVLPDVEQSWITTFGEVATSGKPKHFEDYTATIGRYYEVIAFCPEIGYFAVVISDISDRKKYEIEIQNFNQELENRVNQRTEELKSANRELESFSYSISHDLRAPLRSINGFSQIIMEEYAKDFTPELHHYFDLIQKNAVMMGNLVDDLLNFSRLGRQSLNTIEVNPKMIVTEVLETMQVEILKRKINVIVQDLPLCNADPTLLRQVYSNLIANAIKFTKNKSDPMVEVGCLDQYVNQTDRSFPDGVACYYVKDNGVGFDMKFYDKLFGVFQRLHRAEDYEGTGVGLAIVDRIIKKHGGKIWAESVVGEGTTFYFTLGEPNNGE